MPYARKFLAAIILAMVVSAGVIVTLLSHEQELRVPKVIASYNPANVTVENYLTQSEIESFLRLVESQGSLIGSFTRSGTGAPKALHVYGDGLRQYYLGEPVGQLAKVYSGEKGLYIEGEGGHVLAEYEFTPEALSLLRNKTIIVIASMYALEGPVSVSLSVEWMAREDASGVLIQALGGDSRSAWLTRAPVGYIILPAGTSALRILGATGPSEVRELELYTLPPPQEGWSYYIMASTGPEALPALVDEDYLEPLKGLPPDVASPGGTARPLLAGSSYNLTLHSLGGAYLVVHLSDPAGESMRGEPNPLGHALLPAGELRVRVAGSSMVREYVVGPWGPFSGKILVPLPGGDGRVVVTLENPSATSYAIDFVGIVRSSHVRRLDPSDLEWLDYKVYATNVSSGARRLLAPHATGLTVPLVVDNCSGVELEFDRAAGPVLLHYKIASNASGGFRVAFASGTYTLSPGDTVFVLGTVPGRMPVNADAARIVVALSGNGSYKVAVGSVWVLYKVILVSGGGRFLVCDGEPRTFIYGQDGGVGGSEARECRSPRANVSYTYYAYAAVSQVFSIKDVRAIQLWLVTGYTIIANGSIEGREGSSYPIWETSIGVSRAGGAAPIVVDYWDARSFYSNDRNLTGTPPPQQGLAGIDVLALGGSVSGLALHGTGLAIVGPSATALAVEQPDSRGVLLPFGVNPNKAPPRLTNPNFSFYVARVYEGGVSRAVLAVQLHIMMGYAASAGVSISFTLPPGPAFTDYRGSHAGDSGSLVLTLLIHTPGSR